MEFLKKFKNCSYAVNVIYVIVGLIILFNPRFIGNAINYILGILVIIYGLIYTIGIYQEEDDFNKFDLLVGIICISFGIFLIIHKDALISLIPFSMGIILLMDSFGNVIMSFKLKKIGLKKWWVILIIGLIFLAFSIYIIINANKITEILIRIIGVFLIFDAIIDFLITLRFTKMVQKEIRDVKVIEE